METLISRFITFALRHPWLIIFSTVFVTGMGIWTYTLLRIEAYPDISDTNVIIITKYEGRAAEEVEQQVTIPIERALTNVPDVIDRRSRTIFGLSVVQLSFKDGVEDFFARQYVNEKLQYAALPEGVTPELGPLTSPTGEILRYVLDGSGKYTPMELRTLNDWVIRPQLLQVSGIADIVTFGGPMQQYQVLTSPEKLKKYNLTLKQLMASIEENNLNTGGNIIERGGQGFAVRGIGTIKNARDIENIVISSDHGVPIFLKNVASVEIAPPPPSGVMGYSIPDSAIDVHSATEGIVLLKRGENTKFVLSELKTRLEEVKKELPSDIKLRIIYDRSDLIDYTLQTVTKTLAEGITIVVIVLILFLGCWRSALIVAATIPVSLLFAFILMRITGIPANLLSLGAIDFGIIVDGAAVMVEHLLRHYRQAGEHQRSKGIFDFTEHEAKGIGKEIFFSVSIIILAYLPLFTLQRVEGKLFSPMAWTLSFAILGSMICAISFVPVMLSIVYKRRFENEQYVFHNKPGWFRSRFEHAYEWLLLRLLRRPVLSVAVTGMVIVACTLLGMRMGTEFLPALDEGSIFFRCNQPSGISIHESAKLAPKIREIICQYPQVQTVFTQTGRNDDGTDPFGANRTEMLIVLKDYALWAHQTSKLELVTQIKTELQNKFPGAYFSFGQPIIDQVAEIVNGSAADLAITVTGDTLERTRQYANQIADLVRTIPGASEVGIEQEGPQAQIVIEINRENAARYGINISDIQVMIEAAIGGKSVSTVYEGTKRFDVIVRFLPENRNTIDALRKMLIPAVSGQQIPMSELAEIRMQDGQTNIYRSRGQRILTVRANIRGRDQGGFAAEARQKIASLGIPKEYKIGMGGQFENLTRASRQLAIVIPVTFVIIGIVLFILYKTLRDTLLTILCLPFGIVGGISALLLRDYYFNVSAGVGFISLFGVSVMGGVLLISAYNRALREREGVLTGPDLTEDELRQIIARISRQELRPILMMITVALIGLIPAATSKGIGSDIQRPLATVIIGGLVSCLLLIPTVLPGVYFSVTRRTLIKRD